MTMPDTETLLFVGGPADGKRIAVPKGIPFWTVANLPQSLPSFCDKECWTVTPVTSASIDTVVYEREIFCTPSGTHLSVMCAPGEDVIERLISGYSAAT